MPYSHHASSADSGKSKYQTDADVLHAAHHLVEVYLMYLREHETGSDVFDARELPASKEALVNAFRVVIATESRSGVRTLLIKAGMTLAQFQENIGPRMSVKPAPVRSDFHDGHSRPEPNQIRRLDRALTRLGEDKARLVQVFQHASQIAEKKPVHHA